MPDLDRSSLVGATALNSEERLALESIYLDGISDSSETVSVVSKKSKVFRQRKCGIPAAAPKDRDGLGYYIPPPGGKQLSHLLEPTPGPKYEPNYTVVKTRYPQYTLGGQDIKRHSFKNKRVPGPKYDTRGDMDWGRCRRITVKSPDHRKLKTVGPGPTSARQKPFNGSGPKYSMSGKHKKPPVAYLNNPHVMPIDPNNPGPEFQPSDDYWFEKPRSLGVKHKEEEEVAGPGPGKYGSGKKEIGASYSIGCAGKENTPEEGPGPGKYKLRTTMGKGPKAPLGVKHDRRFALRDEIPGPDIYHRAGFRLDEPGYTMKYRWFDPDVRKTPGPSDYQPTLPKAKGPAFTIKHKAKEFVHDSPGPADYAPSLGNWGKPGKSLGMTWKDTSKDKTSKDHDYPDLETSNLLLRSVPAYSFRKSESKRKVKTYPGPNSYRPKLPESKKTITIGKSIPTKVVNADIPGPAQSPCVPESKVIIDPNCVRLIGSKAASLKSRHSPLKYTGQHNTGNLPPAPREVTCAPLLS